MSTFHYRDPNAPRPNRPRRVSVIALIEHEGRLLLERRADAPVWGLVAGAVEDTESLVEALRREVREETGLEIRSYALFGTFSDPTRIVSYPDGNIVQTLSLAYTVVPEDVSIMRVSEESVELRFFERDELPPAELGATQQPIFERYLGDGSPPFLD